MRFKGKSGCALWLALALTLGMAVWFWSMRSGFDSKIGFWALMAVLAAAAAVEAAFIARNFITVTEGELLVSLGPTRARVEIGSIVSMRKVFSLLASSGASARRVEIVYLKNGLRRVLYVSPADRDGFISAVRGKNPNIRVS